MRVILVKNCYLFTVDWVKHFYWFKIIKISGGCERRKLEDL